MQVEYLLMVFLLVGYLPPCESAARNEIDSYSFYMGCSTQFNTIDRHSIEEEKLNFFSDSCLGSANMLHKK